MGSSRDLSIFPLRHQLDHGRLNFETSVPAGEVRIQRAVFEPQPVTQGTPLLLSPRFTPCITLHAFPGNEDVASTACPTSHHLAAAVNLKSRSITKTTMPTLAPIPARQNGRQSERPRTPNRPGTSSSSKENEVSLKNSAPLADYVCVNFERE